MRRTWRSVRYTGRLNRQARCRLERNSIARTRRDHARSGGPRAVRLNFPPHWDNFLVAPQVTTMPFTFIGEAVVIMTDSLILGGEL